jgi:hypothetical protein
MATELEKKLAGWTGPSSGTEQDKQDRTVRMVRAAIAGWSAFDACALSVYAKGSYANNTNVRTDSDVDIAVQCHEVLYWGEHTPGAHSAGAPYTGIWTPAKLRSEMSNALQAKFGGTVDSSGSTAFRVNSSSARVDADVVPCFDYRYYSSPTNFREGAKVFTKAGSSFENYPKQQITNGTAKNRRTNLAYKKTVRILKRVENAMYTDSYHRVVPSFFVESLVYNCPDELFARTDWTARVKGVLYQVWDNLQGDTEPPAAGDRWLEVNEAKYLFHSAQDWNRRDGRDFAQAAWNYLGLANA